MKYKRIKINLPIDVFVKLAMEAHKKDITFNQHINNLLIEYIQDLEKQDEEIKKVCTRKKIKKINKNSKNRL